jgi:hypothetical protein
MIELQNKKNLIIGKGNERLCFIHPDDRSRIIKVNYKKNKSRDQNKLEFNYFKSLKKRNIDLGHIPNVYGKVQTDLGEGLVYDHIKNFDGSVSVTLYEALLNKTISIQKAVELADDLYKNFHCCPK